MSGSKWCPKCLDDLPVEAFSRNRRAVDGLQFQCKACERAYRQANQTRDKARDKAYREANRETIAAKGKARRAANPEAGRERSRVYREANQEVLNERKRVYHAATRETRLAQRATYRDANRERIQADQRRERRVLKAAALNAYSNGDPKCACCGERTPGFLAIDHIDGDGAEHRRKFGRGTSHRWLRQQGYPEGYRVLCHNCNNAMGNRGVCPHTDPTFGTVDAAPNKDIRSRRRLRLAILTHYSGGEPRCACCGESTVAFLVLDHINSDGGQHRRAEGIKSGSSTYGWVKRNGYPEGFQVLCQNCNDAKGAYGVCPHLDPTAGDVFAAEELTNAAD